MAVKVVLELKVKPDSAKVHVLWIGQPGVGVVQHVVQELKHDREIGTSALNQIAVPLKRSHVKLQRWNVPVNGTSGHNGVNALVVVTEINSEVDIALEEIA